MDCSCIRVAVSAAATMRPPSSMSVSPMPVMETVPAGHVKAGFHVFAPSCTSHDMVDCCASRRYASATSDLSDEDHSSASAS